MVVAGAVGALDASMAVQVKVELCGVADVRVNQSACTALLMVIAGSIQNLFARIISHVP